MRTGISEFPLNLILMILNIHNSSFKSSLPQIPVIFQPLYSAQTVNLPIFNDEVTDTEIITEVRLLEGENEGIGEGRLRIDMDKANISVFQDVNNSHTMQGVQCK